MSCHSRSCSRSPRSWIWRPGSCSVSHTRRQANRGELLVLIPLTLLGLVLGVTLLVNLPRAVALRALGAFVCAYAVYATVCRDARQRLGRMWAVPAGIAGGVLGALFGVGGPPYVMYLTGRITDPARQRATISQMVILNVGFRVVAFAVAGLLFGRDLWSSVAALLPVFSSRRRHTNCSRDWSSDVCSSD